jgi:hypothetical protein
VTSFAHVVDDVVLGFRALAVDGLDVLQTDS